MTDQDCMREAMLLARLSALEVEVPVGAVVTRAGGIVGRGRNRRETGKNALAHAELEAIAEACQTLGGWRLWECTLYVTVEPFIMCAGAIGWAQVSRVVWGADDPKKGFRRYSEAVFHPRTTVARGVLREECEELMNGFFAGLRG